MNRYSRCVSFAVLAFGCMESCSALAQGPDQLPQGLLRVKHRFGDSVQPSYEGWHRQDDGTISMWFGYYNRNTEERVNVPIGPQNKFDLPVADQGQPGYFYPGYHQFVFRVDLPKDWSADKKIVWTLVANGVTLTANGWMVPGYEVDAGVISMNLSSAGGSAEGNNPPVVVGAADQTVEMGKPLKLTVTATDDGFPKPRSTRGSTVQIGGIQLRWEEYRGAGDVEFDPPNVTGEYGKSIEATTLAQFSTPGTYWVRAIGSDTQLEGFHDFKVMVTQPHH